MTKQEALNELKREISVKGHMSKFQERCFEILEADLKNPIEQAIFKEFEELGYEINSSKEEMIVLYSQKRNNNHIFINKLTKSYSSHEDITLQEHQLLHRLFELWGFFDEK